TTAVGVSDMNFNLLGYEELDTGRDRSPAEFLNEISSRVMQMLWKQSITKDEVLGVGVGIVGSVDPESGHSNLAYGIWSQPVNIRQILEDSLGIRVVVENNVRALAVSELSSHKHLGVSNLIFVKHSPGLGSAVIINKRLFYGSTDCAGEIGHMVIEREGPLCRCGQKGCLEALTSAEKIIFEIKELMGSGETPWLNSNTDEKSLVMEEIVEAYEAGDGGVIRVIETALEYMSLGIANVMKIFDPQRVILYGPLFKSDQIFQSLLKKIDQLVPGSNSSSVVQLSVLDSDNRIIGGLSLVLERLFFEKGAISIGSKTA
ncbi:MAG: ROK family protein, partial [Kosmotogaceae bacterium]